MSQGGGRVKRLVEENAIFNYCAPHKIIALHN
jgi:hypothetical protein